MTSETEYEGPGFGGVPDDAPEADVLEQREDSTEVDDFTPDDDVPSEADPVDVEEQRREVGDSGEDDYR
ncbi:hypothetical protein ACIBG5_40380 [Kribbella sp. NPDC050241]|uniref:hypothetical protein n=1 Tax=Kribbella sp. NPDC050241 TaxID=3364115 RepID=UPI0037B9ADA8